MYPYLYWFAYSIFLNQLGHSVETNLRRWGEVEVEKGPVDLFPTELTDEASPRRGDGTHMGSVSSGVDKKTKEVGS